MSNETKALLQKVHKQLFSDPQMTGHLEQNIVMLRPVKHIPIEIKEEKLSKPDMELIATAYRDEQNNEFTQVTASCKCGRGGLIRLQKHPDLIQPKTLQKIVDDNYDDLFKSYDYDGIAEDVLEYVGAIKVIE